MDEVFHCLLMGAPWGMDAGLRVSFTVNS